MSKLGRAAKVRRAPGTVATGAGSAEREALANARPAGMQTMGVAVYQKLRNMLRKMGSQTPN